MNTLWPHSPSPLSMLRVFGQIFALCMTQPASIYMAEWSNIDGGGERGRSEWYSLSTFVRLVGSHLQRCCSHYTICCSLPENILSLTPTSNSLTQKFIYFIQSTFTCVDTKPFASKGIPQPQQTTINTILLYIRNNRVSITQEKYFA